MEEKKYLIYNINTGKYYAGIEGKTVEYTDQKEEAKIIGEADLGNELMKIRLTGEIVECKEV